MSIYRVTRAGHGLIVGDLLFGGSDFDTEGGGVQYRFLAYDELGASKGMVHLPVAWLLANVVVSTAEPERDGANETLFMARLRGVPPVARRPDIDTIQLFFEKNTAPRAPIDRYEMNYELFEQNKVVYFDEFKLRVRSLLPAATDEQIARLWDLLVRCFREKSVDLAKQFVACTAEIGLDPVQAESPRIFWSGKKSKEHAFGISRPPPEATALEMTHMGQLLDKLGVMKTVPWELSTVLWALVSRYFGMGATGDVHVYLDGGFAVGNVFWNDELPMLRLMQRYGAVKDIIMHIWHTRELRWLPEFNIQSDKLLLVFDKAKRVPAPTEDNPEATVSYRFAQPIKVAVLRRTFERFLRSPEREHPLVLYNFRKETCIFARPHKTHPGLKIELFEYGSELCKHLTVCSPTPFEALKPIEHFLMANYRVFEQLPDALTYDRCVIHDGTRILVAAGPQRDWFYREGLAAHLRQTPVSHQRFIAAYSAAMQGRQMPADVAQAGAIDRLLTEIFNGMGALPLAQRADCLRLALGHLPGMAQ